MGLFDLAEANILERQGEIEAACNLLERAIVFAREQPSKGVELRAATALARLWQQQSHSKRARELLIPLYSSFSDGFDTQDLQEAKAVLDALR